MQTKINNLTFKNYLGKINFHYAVLVLIMLSLSIVMIIQSPYFFSIANFYILIDTYVMEAIMALGMTMVIISGGIDLTIAGILPFSSIILALLIGRGISIGVSIILVIAIACGIGCITNELRKGLNLHPMVVTMAISAILKGLDLTITGGTAISSFPTSFKVLGRIRIIGMPISWLVYIVLAVIFLIFSKHNKYFLQVYFVGGNPESAKLSGINTERVYRRVYVMSAMLAAIAGVLTAITYSSASYSYGTNADLRVITTVAIGGTSLTHGGSGSIFGTILGTLFMALIYNAFIMSGMSTYYQDVMTGAFLIIAVLLSEFIRWFKNRTN